jgi:predicted acyltransferase
LTSSPRIQAVDDFRGFAIASMIVVNFMAFYPATPAWLRHAVGAGLTFADLVAPFFLFILGMMYRKSVIRRLARTGRRSTYLAMIRRYFLLLLVGLVGGAVAKWQVTLDWGILQAIGLAGIIALPFIELNGSWRLLAGTVLLGIYWLILPDHIHALVLDSEHGGPFATLAWAALVLFASVAGDWLKRGAALASGRRIASGGLGLMLGGLMLTVLIPVNKHAVSPSYVLVSTGLAALTFAGFLMISERLGISVPTWNTLGKNALVVFLAHYGLVRVGHTLLSWNAGRVQVLVGAISIYGLCYVLAICLQKRRLYWKM